MQVSCYQIENETVLCQPHNGSPPAGSFVVEYVGEALEFEEATQRRAQQEAKREIPPDLLVQQEIRRFDSALQQKREFNG